MSAEEEIKSWIDSGTDYNTGVNLFARYGRNATLKKTFPGR